VQNYSCWFGGGVCLVG